uniref:Vesicle transport protein USE1 n=1 Tax=Oryza brachyantha TaxID=4533 RepID=J3LR81_ORYBR
MSRILGGSATRAREETSRCCFGGTGRGGLGIIEGNSGTLQTSSPTLIRSATVSLSVPKESAEHVKAPAAEPEIHRESINSASGCCMMVFVILIMSLSKVEVNLIRLLQAAPRQQNQAKLVHYVTTARELLEQLGTEATPEGISSVSKAKLSEYSEKIEALAARLAAPEIEALAARLAASEPENEMPIDENREEESSYEGEKPGNPVSLSSGLRRRPIAHMDVGPSSHERKDRDIRAPIKLDAEAQAHIEKHRKLQEDLTDEMVELARQLKESSLTMHQSVQQTEKILGSTERAVEHSLASTGRATTRAAEVYSLASKTTCFQWLLILLMTCMFIMVVLLIRVT